MKLFIKASAFSLALIMLIFTAVACGTPTGGDTTTAAVAQTTMPPEDTDKYAVGDAVPATLSFDNEEITILSRGRDWVKDEVSVEDENGELINDAVFKRNQVVSERLKVKIVNTMTSGTDNYEISDTIRTQIQGGLDDYDVLANSVYATIMYTGENLFADLSDLQYLDLGQPYWSQGFNEAATIGEAQYFVSGAICLSLYRFIFATFFNRNTFTEKSVEYPYKAVNDNTWTIDYQAQITEVFYNDVNGDNKKDVDDKYGFVSNPDMIGVDPYWSAFQLPILTKDAENMLTYTLDIERTALAVEKLNKLFWENTGAYAVMHKGSDAEQQDIALMFSEGKAAMVTLRLIEVESECMRDMADDYGIVPMPKLSDDQVGYYSYAHDTMTAFAVPSNKKENDLEMLGAFLEVMCSESYRYVTPAYYELALKTKYVDDPDSISMLDMITENLYIDPGVLYTKKINSVHQQLRTLVGGNLASTSTYFTALKKSGAIARLVKTLNEEMLKIQG